MTRPSHAIQLMDWSSDENATAHGEPHWLRKTFGVIDPQIVIRVRHAAGNKEEIPYMANGCVYEVS